MLIISGAAEGSKSNAGDVIIPISWMSLFITHTWKPLKSLKFVKSSRTADGVRLALKCRAEAEERLNGI